MSINFCDKISKTNKINGFTMIELVISITIIAIAVLGTLVAVNTATLYSSDPLASTQAVAIAESYLEEIITKSFPVTGTSPCPAPGGTRPNFTNICDYNGISQAPTDQNGNAIAALSGYTVNVTVDTSAATLGALAAGTAAVRIDVAVSFPTMTGMTFSVYRTNYN